MSFRLMACRAFRPFVAATQGRAARRFAVPRTTYRAQAEDSAFPGGVPKLALSLRSAHSESTSESLARVQDTAVDVVADLVNDQEDTDDLEDDGEIEDSDGDSPAPPAHLVDTGNAEWAARVLDIVKNLLAHESRSDLELYTFQAFPDSRRLNIRLDKLTDARGSPTLDDITGFTASLTEAMHRELGEETTASLDYEVSSPGALRKLVVPRELERFRGQPMEVELAGSDVSSLGGLGLRSGAKGRTGKQSSLTLAAEFQGVPGDDPTATVWRLLDVGMNWTALGRKRGQRLGAALLQRDLRIPQTALKSVRFHIDLAGLGR